MLTRSHLVLILGTARCFDETLSMVSDFWVIMIYVIALVLLGVDS
jgi:hypothetical protein